MCFKAALLRKSFGANLTNKLWSYAAFVTGVSDQIPFVFVSFRTLFALIFIGTCKNIQRVRKNKQVYLII